MSFHAEQSLFVRRLRHRQCSQIQTAFLLYSNLHINKSVISLIHLYLIVISSILATLWVYFMSVLSKCWPTLSLFVLVCFFSLPFQSLIIFSILLWCSWINIFYYVDGIAVIFFLEIKNTVYIASFFLLSLTTAALLKDLLTS